MKRNSKGEVSIDGKHIATIPQDRTMLSVLSDNPAPFNGTAVFGKDFWVYVDGKPVRKWLQNVCGEEVGNGGSGVRVWMPNLKDVSKLEARYWKQLEAYNKFYKDCWRPTFDAVAKVKKAHCKVSHKFEGNNPPWWLYGGDKNGISFNWCDEIPKKPLNLKIGQKYYDTDLRLNTIVARKYKFRIALESAIIGELDKVTGSRHGYTETKNAINGEQICFEINGRRYWYHSGFNRHGVAQWKILSWPESPTKFIKI